MHSKGEARHPDCSLKHLIAGDDDANDGDDGDDHDHDGDKVVNVMVDCGIYAIRIVVTNISLGVMMLMMMVVVMH